MSKLQLRLFNHRLFIDWNIKVQQQGLQKKEVPKSQIVGELGLGPFPLFLAVPLMVSSNIIQVAISFKGKKRMLILLMANQFN